MALVSKDPTLVAAWILLGAVIADRVVLHLRGRPWHAWKGIASSLFMAWWWGVCVGQTGFRSERSLIGLATLLVVLAGPLAHAWRSAIRPATPLRAKSQG